MSTSKYTVYLKTYLDESCVPSSGKWLVIEKKSDPFSSRSERHKMKKKKRFFFHVNYLRMREKAHDLH